MWAAAAILFLLLSILSYEVALGFIVASLLLVGVRAFSVWRQKSRDSSVARALWPVAGVTLALLVVGIVKTLKQAQVSYHHQFYRHLPELAWHWFVQLLQFNFWTYLLNMPRVLTGLHRNSALGLGTALASAVIAISTFAYLRRKMDLVAVPERRQLLQLLALGALLFTLGYELFFADPNSDFSSMGITNRFAMASALGAACSLVGSAGLVCSLFPTAETRRNAFLFAIALACGLNCLLTDGIAFFWADASARQSSILRDVEAHVPPLPQRSVLLLDGFCRFTGPAIVFENDWDPTGAVQLALHDSTLTADVVSANMHLQESVVETTMDDQPESRYPYGPNLYVYNTRFGLQQALPTLEVARAYAKAFNPSLDGGCPAARKGHGAPIY